MAYLSGAWALTILASNFAAPLALLLLPSLVTLWFRHAALRESPEKGTTVWLGYRRLSRFLMAATVAFWWMIWDWKRLADVLPSFVPWLSNSLEPSSVETILFCFPPIISLSGFLIFSYVTDKVALRLRWTFIDLVRLVWYRLVSFVFPLLMVATGSSDVLGGTLSGLAWIAGAGIIALIGMVGLRKAEGMKLHEVKASETRNRALTMARKMGITLRRIYVVPAGRGHLTNAFGGAHVIALTDNLGKFLDKREIDFVIAHELAHTKRRHGRRKMLQTAAIFSMMAIALFLFRRALSPIRPVVDVAVILLPLAMHYFFSRRHEYEADREAVEFSGEPETGIRALAGLYRASEAPTRCSRLTELFMTHPMLERRAEAIGRAGQISDSRVSEILRHAENSRTRSVDKIPS